MEKQAYYLGIDLDDENAVSSYLQVKEKEPETISSAAGSEVYQMPLLLAKNNQDGQWCIGSEAKKLALQQGVDAADQLLGRALSGETVVMGEESYPAAELLAVYLQTLIQSAEAFDNQALPEKLVLSMETLSEKHTELFFGMAERLGLSKEQILLIDRKESFYYFALSQKKELWQKDVCLFDYRNGTVKCCRLERNTCTQPQLVTMTEEMRRMDASNPDEAFCRVVSESMEGHMVSAAYLIGDGFDGEWLKDSLAVLCRGRRAFMGKNLYSKGACYAAAVRAARAAESASGQAWPFVYMGDNRMKVNISLKVQNGQKQEFYTLIDAGESWYEKTGECEVLLGGAPEIDFWIHYPNSSQAKLETLELADLPPRPPRTTRLRITAKPLSDTKVKITLKDLGFGEIFKSSDKTWEYVMSLQEGR